jgi:HAE1 family hydrophobic/amphiphilic exporter-1
MGIIGFAINNPVKVTAAVILVVMFGFLSFFEIPVQLTPDVDKPIITVTTNWTGASPQEVENEIVDRQEEKLKSVTDLRRMTSISSRGEGQISLEFNVGTDKDNALRDVIEKIAQVSDYPDEVDRPEVVASNAALDTPIAWLIFRNYTGEDSSTLRDFVDDEIKPILERTPGVAAIDIYGGREREVRVLVDPALMAARGITFRQLEAALRGQNRNISAGTVAVGKRDYTYRTVGEFRTTDDVANTIIDYQAGGPVFVRDIATVERTHEKPYSFVKSKGQYVLGLPVRRETGANVIATMEALKENIAKVNEEVLEARDLHMEIEQVYDETIYINSAIDLVINNIYIGGILATAVLLLFLRSASATLVVAIAIPISVIGSFMMVTLLGRSLNVIMLAGMAFAVGMVVDNAIVVLENIYRHRQLGLGRFDAALKGATEVWGAILASTLTTVAVFLPVIFIEEEAGQLFRDIAIAIATAVTLSLVVAIMVIPAVSARILQVSGSLEGKHSGRFAGRVAGLVGWINRRTVSRAGVVVGLMVFSLVGAWWLMPPATYLPGGNRNLVFGFLDVPPGYTLDEFRRISEQIEGEIRPFWEAQVGSSQAADLPAVGMTKGRGEQAVEVTPPPIDNFFFVARGGGAFVGASSKIEGNVKPLENVLTRSSSRLAGALAFFRQTSLFSSALSPGNTVEVELRSDNYAALDRASVAMFSSLMQEYGYPRPTPTNFNIGRPELQAVINRERAADVGLNVADLGFTVEACINGAFVGGFRDRGDEIDLVVKVAGMDHASEHDIESIQIHTPTGKTVPLGSVVDLQRVFEPQEIRHSEAMRSVLFNVAPAPNEPLQAAMDNIMQNHVGALRNSRVIAQDVLVAMEGNADKLVQTRRALIGSYAGLFAHPRLFGLSPAASLAVILTLGIAAAIAVGALVSRRWGVLVAAFACAGTVLLLVVFNPELAVELLSSRGMLALIVTYLLMAALFESFIYPLVIMLSVPLALVGGFMGLGLTHRATLLNPISPIQQLDVLTMLGFIILIGIVVNNAILIVHQALNNMRDEQMGPNEAIVESVRTRVRPIFMTALTSIGGMLPLVVMSGSGSELYRGLGSVMVGGLMVSTVFTLLLVPAMFSLLVDARLWLRHGLHVSERLAPVQEKYGAAASDHSRGQAVGPI